MYIFVTFHAFNFQIWNFTKRANKDYSWKTAFQVLCCIIFMQSSWTDTESTKTLGICKEQLPSTDRRLTVGWLLVICRCDRSSILQRAFTFHHWLYCLTLKPDITCGLSFIHGFYPHSENFFSCSLWSSLFYRN